MPRYAAFLRGVMPTNARMSELKRAFETAGFEDAATLLSSGNVVFTARAAPVASLQKKAEAAMQKTLGRTFLTFVRGARILALDGTEAFSAYVRSGTTPDFMTLIESAFGKDVTTRTWETVAKVAR